MKKISEKIVLYSIVLFSSINIAYSQNRITDIVIPKGKAVICVARGGGWPGLRLDSIPVLLNQRYIFGVKKHTFAFIIVEPGDYVIASGERYRTYKYYVPEKNLRSINIKENDFVMLELKFKLGLVNEESRLVPCGEKSFIELTEKCEPIPSRFPGKCFADNTYPLYPILSQIEYEKYLKGEMDNLKRMTEAINAAVSGYTSTNGNNDQIANYNNKSYESIFNSTAGATTGTYVGKDPDGMYRVKAGIKCTKCDNGVTVIAGVTTNCPACGGSGRMGGGGGKYDKFFKK